MAAEYVENDVCINLNFLNKTTMGEIPRIYPIVYGSLLFVRLVI